MVGRPSVYTEEIASEILQRMASGESVRAICEDEHMPARASVMLWVATDRESFSDRYAKACDARAHYWADELLDIADDSRNDWMERQEDGGGVGYVTNGEAINRARLRVDTRKWLLSKMLPRYAEKAIREHTGPGGGPIQTIGATMTPQEAAEAYAAMLNPEDSET